MTRINQPQVIVKRDNQFIFTPKKYNYPRTDAYIGSWYPTARPQKHYRYRGTSSSLPTFISAFSSDPINLQSVTIQDLSTEWSISSCSHPTQTIQIISGNGTYDSLPILLSTPLSYSYDGNNYTLGNMINPNNQIVLTWSSGSNTMIWTSTSNTNFYPNTNKPCQTCKEPRTMIGMPFKMLGKNDEGRNRWLTNTHDASGCYTCRPNHGPVGSTVGNISSFSGAAGIRTANTRISKNYYVSYSKYLHNRGKLYDTNNIHHRIPNIQYTQDGLPVWGNQPQIVETTDRFGNPETLTLNSSYYYNNSPGCRLSVFNPSNREFATQGGVDSSTHLERLKYNTIVKNDVSIKKTYNINIPYSPQPLMLTNIFKFDKVLNV